MSSVFAKIFCTAKNMKFSCFFSFNNSSYANNKFYKNFNHTNIHEKKRNIGKILMVCEVCGKFPECCHYPAG